MPRDSFTRAGLYAVAATVLVTTACGSGGGGQFDAGLDGMGSGDAGGGDAHARDGSGIDGSSDAAQDSPSPEGGGKDSGPWSLVCPESAPTLGASCAPPALECEYPTQGSIQYDVACSAVYVCDPAKRTWQAITAPNKCRVNSDNPPVCGSSPRNGTCAKVGDFCLYSTEACFCESILMTPSASWACATCPLPRPRVGSACSGTSSCTYVPCQYAQTCMNGVWQGQPVACGG